MSTINTKDGTEIYYKDWGPKSAQPIVFHHGWPLSGDDWDTQMLYFLSKGYRVIAHDRRGHGRSASSIRQCGLQRRWRGEEVGWYGPAHSLQAGSIARRRSVGTSRQRAMAAFGLPRPSTATDLIPGCHPATRRSSYTLAEVDKSAVSAAITSSSYVR
jgi:pimeloyl-ACP methyl ester carboxylesterase